MTKFVHAVFFSTAMRRSSLAAMALTVAFGAPGCTKQQTASESSSYMIIESIVAARGNEPDKDSGVLDSDVVTKGSVFADLGKVTLRLALKDPGVSTNPATPTTNNYITVTRYHVKYIRTDGRNTQGVDVPFEFDGGATATVSEDKPQLILTLVRVQSKLDAPLKSLAGLGGQVAISTIAEITLFGKDQTGRDVSVKGAITVNFADFADPDDSGN